MKTIKFRGVNDDKTLVYPDKHLFRGLNSGDILQRFSNVEQFTGLQDSKGKDIYEGDVIQFDFGEDSKEGVINSLVIFGKGCFMYRSYPSKQVKKGSKWDQSHDYCNSLWYGPGNYPLCSGFYGKGDLSKYDNSTSKITVIGNIHDNPELL